MSRWKDILGARDGVFVMAVFRLIAGIAPAVLFFCIMSVNNWQLLVLNRTTATTILTWMIMSVAMRSIYGGYEVGRKKSRPIIANLTLGTLLTDVVTYIQLQIMNVNPNNNTSFTIEGRDLLLLAGCVLAQFVLITIVTRLGNEVYFRIHPPRRCMIILGQMSQRETIAKKIGKYRLQWKVTDVALWDAPDMEARIDRAEVVFLADVPDERRMTLLKMCYDRHRDVLCKAQLQDIMLSSAQQTVVDDAPFLEMDYHKAAPVQHVVKRLIDILVSLTLLIALSPLMVLIALAIRVEDGKPVVFRQKRITVGGHEFTICKFRTMRTDIPADVQFSAQRNDPRITRTGRLLRRFRLDELPQLWNILIGDMSLVGPRPEMLENVERYKLNLPSFVYREKMKAGLTGYAQIEGKYNTSPQDKLMLDLMYIEHFSVWEDIKLLIRTPIVFFKKDSTEGFTEKAENTDDPSHAA